MLALLRRPANLYLLLTYLALSAVPFVPLLLGKPLERPGQVLGVACVAWVAVWAVFKRPAYFHWLLIPAFLALPTEIYLYTYYGQGISTHHLGIIAETSPSEAMEFLGSTVWLMLAVMLTSLAWLVSSWRAAILTRDLDWDDASRWAALAVLGVGAGVLAYGYEFGIAGKPTAPAVAQSAAHTIPANSSASTRNTPSARVEGAHAVSEAASAKGADGASQAAQAKSARPAVKPSIPPQDRPVPGANLTGMKLPALPHMAKLPVEYDALANSWPFGLAARGRAFYKERQYLAELGERNSKFSFGARQQPADSRPEIVLMVIGESSRADRWSLNGYARDTNPLLNKEANLINLPDVITSVSATRLSVPVMISRKPATQSLKNGFSEKSFLTAYKEAGFKTFWLSNQVSFGEFDTPVSVFAKEADVVQFLNLGGFTNHSNFDDVLLGPLNHAIADEAVKKLIVLHTLGSHWNYSQRHPEQFDRWQPSLFGVDKPVVTDIKIKLKLNNSYDNTILYTDWFLATVIGRLKQSGQRSAMMYMADHGQALYDNSCKLVFHGHNTQYDFHVPAFVWLSDAYLADRPDKAALLRKHRKARLSTENAFHTLLDLGDIRYPGERPERSFANEHFREHTRYVDSYGWSNYDNATRRGDCREIIDKGKPLKREK
ncbi:phosphoethanolamine transferase [Massilia sp. PAMC28688]|uniref:phosphoethanolamine transferase n=1 Tax=Massilia sp. PAMC28688 TaxID=2861283 RepID=UPI001C62EB6C|nr:phosphoethanolamine transferase [Massilia sp. PAMC28688]QYF94869.1 phosphoethanolamine transferase [Massilia sp. PAMC28688]